MGTCSVTELPTHSQAQELRKKLAMPAVRATEEGTGSHGDQEGLDLSCLDDKEVGRAKSQSSWMLPTLCVALLRAWAL